MKKKASSTPTVQKWLYIPLVWLCALVGKLFLGLKIKGRENLPKDGPLLVMASHEGMLDFLLAAAALRGRTAQFVATQRQFRNPKLHPLYVRMGVIPKVQFRSDPRCVMNILRVLKKGGTVVIFPAGQTSAWGVPGNIAPSMARLVKKAGVPVCTLGLPGGFFTAPRMGGLHRGKTEARLELAFTAEELPGLSEEAIYARLREKLDFNEYTWQQQTGVRFKGKNRALGYDQLLIHCPKCGGVGTWRTEGDDVRCHNCGNAGFVGSDMHLHPKGENDKLFPTLPQWYAWQEGLIAQELRQPDFLLEEPVVCRAFEEERFDYREAGRGVLRLDREEIRYEGTFDDRPVRLAIRHENLPGLSAEPGVYVELFHEGYGLLRYAPQGKATVARMKLAQEYLYRQTL